MHWPNIRFGAAVANLAVIAAVVGTDASLFGASSLRQNDIPYARRQDGELRLDACRADGPGPHPVAILVHGGGWAKGDKNGDPAPFFSALTDAGFVWFSLNYRLSTQAPYPACLEDVEEGVDWICLHLGDFEGDSKNIVFIGGSAGAQLVSMVALRGRTRCHPAAVVALYCPSDMTALNTYWTPEVQKRLFGAHPPVDRLGLFVGSDRRDPQFLGVLRNASPINSIRPGLPPFLLVHGTADETVPLRQSIAFQARLRAQHDRCDLIAVPGALHGLMNPGDGTDHKLFEAAPGIVSEVIGWLIATIN